MFSHEPRPSSPRRMYSRNDLSVHGWRRMRIFLSGSWRHGLACPPPVSMTGENVELRRVNVVWPTPGSPIPSDAFLSVPGVPTDHRGCGPSCGTAWVFGWVANGRGRLMRLAGIAGITRRKTTYRRHRRVGEVSADLVDRQFSPTEPDQLWVTDIERHEAFSDRAVVKGHRLVLVAASVLKLRAA